MLAERTAGRVDHVHPEMEHGSTFSPRLEHRCDSVRVERVVRVEENDHVAAGGGEAGVERGALPPILFQYVANALAVATDDLG
jgi:hypothetical protein